MKAHLIVDVLVVVRTIFKVVIVALAVAHDFFICFIIEDLSKKYLKWSGLAIHRNILFPIDWIVISVLVAFGIRVN